MIVGIINYGKVTSREILYISCSATIICCKITTYFGHCTGDGSEGGLKILSSMTIRILKIA